MGKRKLPEKICYVCEQDGLFSINSKSYGRKYFNITGKFIIDSINAGESISEILEGYSVEFERPPEEAKRDVYHFLRELQFLMFLRFESAYFQDVIETPFYGLNIAGEDDYVPVSQYIRQNLKKETTLYCENNNLKYYNDFTLRSRSFNNIEVIFFLYEPDGTYSNIIGINGLTSFDKPAKISILICRNINTGSLSAFYKLVEKELIRQGKKKVQLLLTDNRENGHLSDFFREAGFFLEAVLKYELGEHHQYIYSKYLIDQGD